MALSKFDDYLIHQIAEPFDTLGTDDPNFMDRLWFMAYSEDGELQLMAGLGSHPNKQLMDGFLLVRHKGIQRNARFSRHLKNDRSHTAIGPLSFEILEPMERWHLKLDENDFGIGCDLEFVARTQPYLFPTLAFKGQGQRHYKQPGRCSGTITFEGKTFDVNAIPSVRDRSWGVRKPGIVSGLNTLLVLEAHFEDCSTSLNYCDSSDGFRMNDGGILHDDGRVQEIVAMGQQVTFEGDSKQFSKVEMQLQDSDGKILNLIADAISPPCYFTGGGYDGRHGKDYGPYHEEGERWDLEKDAADASAVFPYYSRLVKFQLDGKPGIGHVEAFFSQNEDWVYQPSSLND